MLPGRSNDKIFLKNAILDSSQMRTIEILAPNVQLNIGFDKKVEKTGTHLAFYFIRTESL